MFLVTIMKYKMYKILIESVIQIHQMKTSQFWNVCDKPNMWDFLKKHQNHYNSIFAIHWLMHGYIPEILCTIQQ